MLNQTYQDLEYIVIDGVSTDGTIEIVKSYGDKISIFLSELDQGIYDGLNKGVSLATGDIICFLHSDDIYASNNVVQLVVNEFLTDYAVDGVYGDLVYTLKTDTSKVLRYWKSKDFTMKLLKQGWMPAHPTLFLRREVYEKYGNFDLDFRIAADYDFMLRILKGGVKVKYLSEVLYRMRTGGKSNNSMKNIALKTREDLQVLKKNNIGGFGVLVCKNLSKLRQFVKFYS